MKKILRTSLVILQNIDESAKRIRVKNVNKKVTKFSEKVWQNPLVVHQSFATTAPGAGDSGGVAGLRYHIVIRQFCGLARAFDSHKNSRENHQKV